MLRGEGVTVSYQTLPPCAVSGYSGGGAAGSQVVESGRLGTGRVPGSITGSSWLCVKVYLSKMLTHLGLKLLNALTSEK